MLSFRARRRIVLAIEIIFILNSLVSKAMTLVPPAAQVGCYPAKKLNMDTWEALIPLAPKAWARPRFNFRLKRAYEKEDVKVFKQSLQHLILLCKPKCFEGPIAVQLHFYLKQPKSNKNRRFPDCRPDIDNLAKGVLDAANGILWIDDAQIVEFRAVKHYGEEGIGIVIQSL